jgi:hypothetical protein
LQALVLEQKHPWLLAIKQILGIKDPEGPKAAKVPRTAILLEVPPHQEKAVKTSKHLTSPLMLTANRRAVELIEVSVHQEKKPVKKHRTGPLMLKAKRQALEKFKRFH